MRVKWFGHSCFMFTSENKVRLLTDPCDNETGYMLSGIETDIVTVSHKHHDHAYMDAVVGNPDVFDSVGSFSSHGIRIEGIPSFHDEVKGKKRGENIIFKFTIDDINFVHAGDIGCFDKELCDRIGETDVLLVPVGGVYTIDAQEARAFANMLNAKMVIPMHYKTPALTFDLDDINSFVDNAVDCSIHRLGETEAVLSKEYLGRNRILIMSYK